MERLGLQDLAMRAVGRISGGQRQRVALARALAAEPRALLLDEPFGSLDVATRGAVRSELRAFLAGCGLPTVLVTHDPVDALAFGDRIAVLEAGRLSQIGTREQLLAEPRTAFVAELAGLNLYRAELAYGRGLKEARVRRPGLPRAGRRPGRAGLPGLRALRGRVVRRSGRPAPRRTRSRDRCSEVLPLPDRLRVVLDTGVVVAAEITREAGAALGLAPGRTLWAAVKATAIRVYS